MAEPALRQIIEEVNHNADLLEKHLSEGVHVHRQIEPSTIWAVQHSLGSLRPLIETYDSNGNRIGHSVNRQTQTFNCAEITFAVPIAGYAVLRF